MPIVRVEILADSRDQAKRLRTVYARGERDPDLESEVSALLAERGLTARSRPRLAGTTASNPPVLLVDTDVHLETRT